jgi:hypothetical protein
VLVLVSQYGIAIADCTLVGGDDSYHMQMNEYSITLDNNGSSDTPDDGELTKALLISTNRWKGLSSLSFQISFTRFIASR